MVDFFGNILLVFPPLFVEILVRVIFVFGFQDEWLAINVMWIEGEAPPDFPVKNK